MNILIVKLSAIGDVVHTLPSLAALREIFPDAHITWVVEEAASGLLTDNPYIDTLLVSRRKRWLRGIRNIRNARGTLKEIMSFYEDLRVREYELVIDFHGLLKSSIIVLLSRGARRLGYDSLQELSGLFLTEKIYEDMTKHAVDRYLDFPRYLGWKGSRVEFPMYFDETDRSKVLNLLESNDIDISAPFVAVNPVAFWKTKLWDEKRFAVLCDRIVSLLGVTVILTGSQSDGPLSRIRQFMEQDAVNLGGMTTLRELAFLYSLSRLVITTDSGPMHIAAAVGTHTVALFGPTDPGRTGPYGRGHSVINKGLECSPCFRKNCPEIRCMKEITVDDVFEAVRNQLVGGYGE